jgi:hypothetical protein
MRNYFSYLLRLRQATAHPFLLEGALQQNFTLEDLRWLRNELSKIGGKIAVHMQISAWVEMEYEDQAGSSFGSSGFGGKFDMDSQLEQMEKSKKFDDVICRACYDPPDKDEPLRKLTEVSQTRVTKIDGLTLIIFISADTHYALLALKFSRNGPESTV